MATLLYRKQGEIFFDNAGNRLIAGKVFYFQAGTSIPQATFSDNAGTIANPNPIALNGDGRLTVPVYFGSTNNYKELVTDQNNAIISPWPFDNIPCAVAAPSVANFSQTLLPWTFITSLASPVAVSPSDAGKAFECDTSGGNIVFNLPAASVVGSGLGYTFKKTTAPNSVTITANGTDLIDGGASLIINRIENVFQIFSDGANWQVVTGYAPFAMAAVQGLTIANDATTPNTKIDISAAQGILTSAAGVPFLFGGGSLVIDMTTTGANGLDTGSRAANTWYYSYLISNGTTVAALASLSPTAPTLPTGYLYSMRVGAMLTDGSSNLRGTFQAGRRVTFTGTLQSFGVGGQAYNLLFPPTSESGFVLATCSAGSVINVTDLAGRNILQIGANLSGSISNSAIAQIPNILGGTTFNLGNIGSGQAYGYLDRVNAT